MRISPVNSDHVATAAGPARSAPQAPSRAYDASKRAFDLLVGVALLPVLALPMLLIALLVRLSSPGPIIFWSDRVGRNNVIFRMPKFRTMYADAPQLATDLMAEFRYHTPLGKHLRKTSLDELPQLWSVIRGDMSLVGPRPALFNQYEFIEVRTSLGVHKVMPGITGWAQINGRNHCTDEMKAAYDAIYLARRSFWFDLRILLETIPKVLSRQGVSS